MRLFITVAKNSSLFSSEDVMSQDYQEKISDFRDKFAKARQDFIDSLQVEIAKGVHWLGERYAKFARNG